MDRLYPEIGANVGDKKLIALYMSYSPSCFPALRTAIMTETKCLTKRVNKDITFTVSCFFRQPE